MVNCDFKHHEYQYPYLLNLITDNITEKVDEEWKPLKSKIRRAIRSAQDNEFEEEEKENGNNGKIPEDETSERYCLL